MMSATTLGLLSIFLSWWALRAYLKNAKDTALDHDDDNRYVSKFSKDFREKNWK